MAEHASILTGRIILLHRANRPNKQDVTADTRGDETRPNGRWNGRASPRRRPRQFCPAPLATVTLALANSSEQLWSGHGTTGAVSHRQMKRLLYLSFLPLPLIGCYGGERRETGE